MRLRVNGEILEISDIQTLTVIDLLKKLGINPGRVAVEVNLSIIKKADYQILNLNDGDRVEIVNFIGGG